MPENVPWAVPWEQITAPVPAVVRRIRGTLNVPRERFHITADGRFTRAGLRLAP